MHIYAHLGTMFTTYEVGLFMRCITSILGDGSLIWLTIPNEAPRMAKKLSFFQELLCWASAPEGHCFNLLSGLASFSDTPTCCQMMRKSAIVVSLIGSNHYHQPSLKAKLCLSFQISPTIIYLSFIESAWFFSIPVTRLKDEQAHQTAEEWTSTSLGNP